MKTYTFNAVIGEDEEGKPIYKEFVVEANSFAEARHKLSELLQE